MKGSAAHVIHDTGIDLGFEQHELDNGRSAAATGDMKEGFAVFVRGVEGISFPVEFLEFVQIPGSYGTGCLHVVGVHFGGAWSSIRLYLMTAASSA